GSAAVGIRLGPRHAASLAKAFFFSSRRRHTRFSRDWSSDVCSSDLDSLGKQRLTWLQLADAAGMATGIVSTARLTHATPAATWAHSPDRNWESDADMPAEARAQGCLDIARQTVATPYRPRPKVMPGGGR